MPTPDLPCCPRHPCRFFGDKIYYRGIVEFSNVCANDCGYCGIRKHQPGIHRWARSHCLPAAKVQLLQFTPHSSDMIRACMCCLACLLPRRRA
jgi:hypothetical protein